MDKALQDALDYACAQGRIEGGWEIYNRFRPNARLVAKPGSVALHLNGGGLKGLMDEAIKQALWECHGNKSRTAEMLKISTRTLKRAFPLLLILCLGCVTKKPVWAVKKPMSPPLPLLTVPRPIEATIQGAAIVNPDLIISWTHRGLGKDESFEVQESKDLNTWISTYVTNLQFRVLSSSHGFFRVRAVNLQYNLFSDWATTR